MKTHQLENLIDTINALKAQVSELTKNNLKSNFEDELLSRQEVAKMLKIDLSTLHHWAKSGKLIKYGIGNRVYFKRSEIESALVEIEPLNY